MLLFCCCFIVLFCFVFRKTGVQDRRNNWQIFRSRTTIQSAGAQVFFWGSAGGREEFPEFQGATCEGFVALLYAPLRQKHFLQLPASQASQANG